MLAAAFVNSAAAADNATGTDLFSFDAIVVSADRPAIEQVSTVREISAEEIEQQGARTLNQALALVPGVHIRSGGKGVPRVDMRGFRTRHVLLLLDGIPLNSTFDGQFDPEQIPVEHIEKIKVTYANSSVLYGQGGLGGVINIITKKGEQGFHGSIDERFGENLKRHGAYTLSGANEKLDFFFSGSRFKSVGFELPNDFNSTDGEKGGLRENSDRERKYLFGRLNYAPTDRLMFGLTANYHEGLYGIPPNTISDRDDPFAKTVKHDRVDDYDGFSMQLSGIWDAPGPWELKAWAYTNALDMEDSRYDDDTYSSMDDLYVKKTYQRLVDTNMSGANIQARCDLDRMGAFTLAGGLEQDKWEEDGKMRDKYVVVGGAVFADAQGSGGDGSGGGSEKKKKTYYMRYYSKNNEIKIYSSALEYELVLLDSFTLLLGYGHYWLSKDLGSAERDSSLLAGISYEGRHGTKLHGSWSRKIRFPSISQLYDEDKGNTGLDTERAHTWEIGLARELPLASSLRLTGFYSDITDYIEKDDATDYYKNTDKYRFQGFELELETRCVTGLRLWASYTFLDTINKTSGTDFDQRQYTPRDKISLQATYTTPFGTTLYASLLHTNRQYYYTKREPYLKAELNEYTVVNCKATQTLLHDRLKVYFGVDNLFDEDYETSYGLTQAGKYIYGGVKVSY